MKADFKRLTQLTVKPIVDKKPNCVFFSMRWYEYVTFFDPGDNIPSTCNSLQLLLQRKKTQYSLSFAGHISVFYLEFTLQGTRFF